MTFHEVLHWFGLGLSPGQTDSQVDAIQRKFAKAELAYGLVKGGQNGFASRLASRKKPYISRI